MKRIVLMRHGLSEGNIKGIIQGELNYPLSQQGIMDLKKINLDNTRKFDRLFTSDLDRAKQTAIIISELIEYNSKILETDILRENNFGILSGLTKEEAKQKYPDLFKEYMKRGDLDLIKSANGWRYNQARALAFLQQYIGKEEYNDLIVSHGSFIRIFYNLCLGRERNTKLDDIVNGKMYEINNPLDGINIEKIEIAKTAEVFKISTFDNEYILKRYNRKLTEKDYLEKDLLEYLSLYSISPYYYYINNCFDTGVKLMKFEEGVHKFNNLTNNELKRVLKVLKKMKELLEKYDSSKFENGNINYDLQECKKKLFTEKAKKICESLLTDEKFNNYLANARKSLVHNDLHRSNILLNNGEVKILDFDNIKIYPEDLQIATFICSFLILEGEYNYQNILNGWDNDVDLEIIDKLIKYRLIYGLSFFEEKIKNNDYNNEDLKIRKKYLKGIGL